MSLRFNWDKELPVTTYGARAIANMVVFVGLAIATICGADIPRFITFWFAAGVLVSIVFMLERKKETRE
ncbi:hypothetical protein [Streptomyces sp. NPDC055085]